MTTQSPPAGAGVEERAGWLPIPPESSLDEDLQRLFGRARERLGFIPNVFRVFSLRPDHLKKWRAHFTEVTEGPSQLTKAEREMIAVVVSSQNHCLYCMTSHGASLRVALEDGIFGDRITMDYRRAGLDERTTAMLEYAEKLTRHPVECSEADIERLRGVGFTDEGIFDIIETTAMYNFTNRLAAGTGMMPNREYHSQGR